MSAIEIDIAKLNSQIIKKKITGIYCSGDYINKPLIFNNSTIVINWSYYFIKLEFASSIDELPTLLHFYTNTLYYGEWGEEAKKPTTWMYIEDENGFLLKDKEYIKIDDIINASKTSKFIKFNIFFETTIADNPLDSDYLKSNSYWINCIGGLYDTADLALYTENNDDLDETRPYYNNVLPFVFHDYSHEDLHAYAIETAHTSKELILTSKKWQIFEFKPSIVKV